MTDRIDDTGLEIMLKIDGSDVPMNPFVKKIFTRTILGMISSLSGLKESSRIEIDIFPKS